MKKKPFFYAFGAALYIVMIVLVIKTVATALQDKADTVVIPMTMLSLFVLSAAIMGFLFLSEPLRLYFEGQKKEAFAFFGKIVGIFACFAVLYAILLFLV